MKEKKWTDYSRNDLKSIPVMEKNGWTPVFNDFDIRRGSITPDYPPNDGVGFKKGDTHVWRIIKHDVGVWRVAELIDGYYVNHRTISYLSELIEDGNNNI